MNVQAPAKLNRLLKILGKRADGYHSLQTVFQFIDLCDELTIETTTTPDISFTCGNDQINSTDNLAYRAARLLQTYTQTKHGAVIELIKHIPIGAGLGGGSSDAATTLVTLNRLWQTGLSTQTLLKLGLQLGADVPIFIFGESAEAQGVGDILQPIDLDEYWYILLIPACHVSTQKIFCDPQLTRDSLPSTISELSGQFGQNDCESTTRRLYPEVDEAMHWLSQHTTAMMTGTGCGVYALCQSQVEAREIAKNVPDTIKTFIVKGCNQSPLYNGELRR